MQRFLQDLRFSLRIIWKNPFFYLVVILTLALGIGATTAVFSVVNGVVLRPLPYQDSDRIVVLYEERRSDSFRVWGKIANFLDWREQNQVFEHLAHFTPKNFTLSAEAGPEAISGAQTSANFFRVLGAEPFLGRAFHPEEEQPGAEPVAVLSHKLWRAHFGADESWLGRSVILDNTAHTIIGVLPPEFEFSDGGKQDLWTARVFSEEERANRNEFLIRVIGRLKAGISPAQAQADLDRVARGLEELYPEENGDCGIWMGSLQERIVGNVKFTLLMLLGCVTVVLIIACANVINLLLARSMVREREVALRMILGAGRRRMIQHFLTESLVLSVLAAIGGLLFARLSMKLLAVLGPGMIPRLSEVDVDLRVLAFALVVSLLLTVVLGLVMSFRAFHTNLLESIKSATMFQSMAEMKFLKPRNLVVALETGLVLGLVIFGALLFKSYRKLSQVDPGFESEGRIAVDITLPDTDYPDADSVVAFYERLLEEIDALPGIEASGTTTHLPLRKGRWSTTYRLADSELPESKIPRARFDAVSPEYFRAMGISLLAGRSFTAADRKGTQEVIVVNRTMANRHWNEQEAVGQFLQRRETKIEIIGVVDDVRYGSLSETGEAKFYGADAQMAFYYATRQVVAWTQMEDPEDAVPLIRDAVLKLDERLPLTDVVLFDDLLKGSLAHHRFNTFLFMVLGFIGLFLGAVGVYGVVSYSVSQRTQEMGIRLALGARRVDVLKMVLKTELIPVLVGVAFGIVTALALSRTLSSLLYEVSTNDPLFYVAGTCLLLFVTSLAVAIPALRASRVDPMTSVRYE